MNIKEELVKIFKDSGHDGAEQLVDMFDENQINTLYRVLIHIQNAPKLKAIYEIVRCLNCEAELVGDEYVYCFCCKGKLL